MTNIRTFTRRLSYLISMSWRHKCSKAATVCLAMALLPDGAGLARQAESDKAVDGVFHYKPYTESEIEARLQKPLALDDCIRIALRNNITLRISEGDLARAEASRAGSYGAFLPVFTLSGARANSLAREARRVSRSTRGLPDSLSPLIRSNFDNQATIVGEAQLFTLTGATLQFANDFVHDVQSPPDQAMKKNDKRSYSFTFTQPLLRGAGPMVARNQFLSAGYDEQIQSKRLDNTKLQTVLNVKRAYYDALSKREIVKVNESAVASDSVLINASQALIVAKLASRRDLLSAQIRFADDRTSLITSENDYQFALDALKDVMGVPIEMPIALDSTGLKFVPVTLNEAALIRSALETSPSLQSQVAALQQRKLQHRVAKNAVLPQLDFVASYSSDLGRDAVLNQDASRSSGWEATVNVSYTFLNRDEAAKAEDAQIAVRQQEDQLREQQRQIVINVRDIVRSVYSGAEEINAIQQSIRLAEDKYAFANTMFSLGRASNFDITDAQEFLLKAKNQYLRKLVEYYTQLALLESLTGQRVTP